MAVVVACGGFSSTGGAPVGDGGPPDGSGPVADAQVGDGQQPADAARADSGFADAGPLPDAGPEDPCEGTPLAFARDFDSPDADLRAGWTFFKDEAVREAGTKTSGGTLQQLVEGDASVAAFTLASGPNLVSASITAVQRTCSTWPRATMVGCSRAAPPCSWTAAPPALRPCVSKHWLPAEASAQPCSS
jgi:hypothetical protein